MNILLIDDDESCLKSLASILNLRNTCQTFTMPKKAIEMYKQSVFDVVITDFYMPDMNGIQVLQQLRSLNHDAKVVIMTGYLDPDTIISVMNNRAYALLGKPLIIDELMATLERIEQENRERERVMNEHANLVLEFAQLKIAFEELLDMLKNWASKKYNSPGKPP
ncbi:MAG: response regulator [Thermacetogeniaceae bacterium]